MVLGRLVFVYGGEANSAFHPSEVIKWGPASAAKANAGNGSFHSWLYVCGCAGKTVSCLDCVPYLWGSIRLLDESLKHDPLVCVCNIGCWTVCYCYRHPFTRQLLTVSNGSGFIVREDGIILTNAHVVANNNTVRVKLHDGRSFDGHVQSVDNMSDLATVKINAVSVSNVLVRVFIAHEC